MGSVESGHIITIFEIWLWLSCVLITYRIWGVNSGDPASIRGRTKKWFFWEYPQTSLHPSSATLCSEPLVPREVSVPSIAVPFLLGEGV